MLLRDKPAQGEEVLCDALAANEPSELVEAELRLILARAQSLNGHTADATRNAIRAAQTFAQHGRSTQAAEALQIANASMGD